MKLSILHISDLHRDSNPGLTNDALFSSLERDWSRYIDRENPQIKSPDIIIVSGDIIQGVRANVEEPEEKISQQYEQALDFLSRLSQTFLDGNKERLILVPGNHDVSAYHFCESIEKLNINKNDPIAKELVSQLFKRKNNIRWSWKELDFYKIVDENLYNNRLKSFCDFYKEFYQGKKEFNLIPEEQFNIYDCPEFNLVIVGLSSCFRNDLYNKQGAINPEALAKAANQLNNFQYYNKLRLAVWHHNLSGTPLQNDYMNSNVLQNLIDCDFSLGFHGHQHKPQFINEYSEFGQDNKITIISAGTLCGGSISLPSGYSRAYNLVEIDTETLSGRLHLREMQDSSFDFPIWSSGLIKKSGKSYIDFTIQPPPKAPSENIQIRKRLEQGEEYYRNNEYKKVIKVLHPLVNKNEFARKFLLECYFVLEDMKAIIDYFDPPKNNKETIYLFKALWTEDKKQRLHNLLHEDTILNSTDPSVISIRDQYIKRLK